MFFAPIEDILFFFKKKLHQQPTLPFSFQMGSIYFKLSSWSQNNFESVPIDSNAPQISIGELKQLIWKKKKLASNVGLIITNAQTNEEYKQETDTIQRNSSVIVKVVPNYSQSTSASVGSGSSSTLPTAAQPGGYRKTLPPGYICHQCGATNSHHASECPTRGDTSLKKKPQTMHGVPRSFLNQDLTKGPSFKPNEFEFDKAITAAGLSYREQNTVEIPPDLKCSLCNKLLRNAVSIPCCMASACDECIRSALLEEENDFHCPLCRNPVIPDNLIANKTLRVAVDDYLAGQQGTSDSKNATKDKSKQREKKPKENRNKGRNRSKSPEPKRSSREKSPKRSRERSPDRSRESRDRSPHREREKEREREREKDRERERERERGERERGDRARDGNSRESRDRRRSDERHDRERGDKERDYKEDREKRKSRENSPDQRRERNHSENKRSRH
eukprot:TRINITY_DN2771_c1_g4_i1.p1 TRINITY_DN2771_c1_g4~~TRINITY_DN2771_c1_g4_i1.p1  ORF type:complete len:448 (-),score=140.05 TRINITY_DN2771_c1_g4_i1:25-1368(-)